MSTSPKTSFLSDVLTGEPIPHGKIAYFRGRQRNAIYTVIAEEFIRRAKESGLTKAQMGRIIRKRPEVIGRWLGTPGNWTLDTVSDLALSMGMEMKPILVKIEEGSPVNQKRPAWFYEGPPAPFAAPAPDALTGNVAHTRFALVVDPV